MVCLVLHEAATPWGVSGVCSCDTATSQFLCRIQYHDLCIKPICKISTSLPSSVYFTGGTIYFTLHAVATYIMV